MKSFTRDFVEFSWVRPSDDKQRPTVLKRACASLFPNMLVLFVNQLKF